MQHGRQSNLKWVENCAWVYDDIRKRGPHKRAIWSPYQVEVNGLLSNRHVTTARIDSLMAARLTPVRGIKADHEAYIPC